MPVKKDKIESIMTTAVVTVDIDKSLHYAKTIFDKKKIRHLPVVDNRKLVGMLSLTDIMRLSFGNTYGIDDPETDKTLFEMLTIGQVMKEHPMFVDSEDSIKKVAEILIKEEFHALPVVKGFVLTCESWFRLSCDLRAVPHTRRNGFDQVTSIAQDRPCCKCVESVYPDTPRMRPITVSRSTPERLPTTRSDWASFSAPTEFVTARHLQPAR